jgi:2-phospho-L-lactate guanylyltransferase (CobY/MobA/RfbA family)
VGDERAGRGQHVDERRLTTLRRVPTIVVPYRGDAKLRLPAEIRAAVAVAMLGDVVAAALEVGPVVVVTDDLAVVPPDAGAHLDPGGGLGAAVGAGLATVDGHALVVNADLPTVTPDAIRRLAAAGLALVEAADGTTNALALPDPAAFAPLYGPGSANRFRAHAPFATLAIAELAQDVDTQADLERLAPFSGPRTRALVAVHA